MEEIGFKIMKYFFDPDICYSVKLHWSR